MKKERYTKVEVCQELGDQPRDAMEVAEAAWTPWPIVAQAHGSGPACDLYG
jgi:hypothetical protein